MHLSHICGVPPEKVKVHCTLQRPFFIIINYLYILSQSLWLIVLINFRKITSYIY